MSALNRTERRRLRELSLTREVTLPNRVRAAMEIRRVTQEELSRALGVSQPFISRIANGMYTSLSLNTARKFADYFGVPVDDLFPVVEQHAGEDR